MKKKTCLNFLKFQKWRYCKIVYLLKFVWNSILCHLTSFTFWHFQHILLSFDPSDNKDILRPSPKKKKKKKKINEKWQNAMKAILQAQNLNEQWDFWMIIKTKPTNILKCDHSSCMYLKWCSEPKSIKSCIITEEHCSRIYTCSSLVVCLVLWGFVLFSMFCFVFPSQALLCERVSVVQTDFCSTLLVYNSFCFMQKCMYFACLHIWQ